MARSHKPLLVADGTVHLSQQYSKKRKYEVILKGWQATKWILNVLALITHLYSEHSQSIQISQTEVYDCNFKIKGFY